MLNYFKELFTATSHEQRKDPISNTHRLQIAACALLVEIARADDQFTANERKRITDLMKSNFQLTENEVNNLITESEESIKNSISLYEFTDVLNQHLNNDEKYLILKYLWHIAYSDGNLDTYEDHYIKKISNNLHMYNRDRIAAKLEVKKELEL